MRIAIAGASGFVGQALTEALLRAGHTVLALTRSQSSPARDLPPELLSRLEPRRCSFHLGPLRKPVLVHRRPFLRSACSVASSLRARSSAMASTLPSVRPSSSPSKSRQPATFAFGSR